MYLQRYRELCGELKAPENKIEEVIQMAENMPNKKHHRPVKIAVALVAVVAAMIVAVSAAGPQTLNDMVSYVVYNITGVGGEDLQVEARYTSIDPINDDEVATGTYKFNVVDGNGVVTTEEGEGVIYNVTVQDPAD